MGYFSSLWKNTNGYLRRVSTNQTIQLNVGVKKLLITDQRLSTRIRIFLKNIVLTMNEQSVLHPLLRPPQEVKGMTVLTKNTFNKTVQIPCFKMPKREINKSQKIWRPLLLKMKGIKPIAVLDIKDPLKDSHNMVLLDPAKIEDEKEKERIEKLENLGFSLDKIEKFELDMGYDNWSVSDVMKAVLPEGTESVSSFTQIGHIAHLNLKEDNLPYKNLIGEVILDKIPSVKTVVNKLNTIDNTYRNFEMELLAGERNFITQTKEHNCTFELDFSKVYWNSRLSTEHSRIVETIPSRSIVYDVFAGVGPFTVPLAKKKRCTILANDLNPHSFEALEKNIKLNKLDPEKVKAFKMDGRDFIRNIVKPDLISRLKSLQQQLITPAGSDDLNSSNNNSNSSKDITNESNATSEIDKTIPSLPSSYAVMNLPALAIEFIDAFASLLLSDLPDELVCRPDIVDKVLPTVFCYTFCAKGDDMEGEVKRRAEKALGQSLPSDAVVRNVRNVSPNKEMMCLSFKCWSGLVLGQKCAAKPDQDADCEEPSSKKFKQTEAASS